jgi:transposase InsO family protein
MFAAIHGLAHPGIRATRRLVWSRFVWHGCASDVAGWCRDCQTCQRGKVTRQPAAATQNIPVPERQFTHLHVDLVGPLPTSAEGFKYLFTIIDRSTRWVEAIPVKNMEAATIADALVAGWVSQFGVPAVITFDRGTQFTSAVREALCKRLHIQHIITSAFHPCSNGMVERCHRQLKDALRARSAANDWPDHLPWVLLGLRAAPKEDSAVSSAEMVLGDPLVLPGQLLAGEEPPPPQRSYRDALSRIPIPSRVYLIDTGNKGRARDSRRPPPHPPVDLFLTGGRDESR